MKYYVYILYSERDGGIFIDHTDDMAQEMARHEAGEIRNTKYRRPLKLIHKELAGSFNQVKMRKRYWESGGGQKEIESWIGPIQKRKNKYEYRRERRG